MEIRNEEKFFVCSRCFMQAAEFMLNNPKKLKEKDLPDHLTIHPVESSDTYGKCERCDENTVDGYIPLAKPEQVVVT